MKFFKKPQIKIEITKEHLEKELGYEIDDFTLEPIYLNGSFCGMNICVKPKQKV